MNKNKIKIQGEKLSIMCTVKTTNRTFFLSVSKPYNPENGIIIEEIDENKDIIGLVRIPKDILIEMVQEMLKEYLAAESWIPE